MVNSNYLQYKKFLLVLISEIDVKVFFDDSVFNNSSNLLASVANSLADL